ncbi:MAG: BatA domain-containing protein [Hymenobacteraceae bacterium]|nr:BatA domain-containing protein [Hymenobacteraceae bacterium]
MVFLIPSFLWGLLALAIPIIIHLVEMRRPQRVVFTNVAFLREVKQVTARSRRLKRLLILAARCLALAALVLAFAQPFRPARNAGAPPPTDVRLYLDNSLSMQNVSRTAAVALLDEAKSQIRQLSTVFGNNTRFRLLDNAFSGGITGVPAPTLLDGIARLGYSPRRATSAEALTRLLAPDDSGPGTRVFLYSDFQRNAFSPKALLAAAGDAEVYLLPLAAQTTRNVYVDTVALTDEFVRANETNRLLVRVANAGAEKATGVAVKVLIGDQQVSAFNLDLAPGERKSTEIDFRVTGATGPQRGRVVVTDVPVTFDNTYYFTLRVAPPIKVFGLGPATIETPAQKAFAAEPGFAYTPADERGLNYQTAAAADLLLIQELPSISAGLAENARKFVLSGGSVLVIPAVGADRRSYNVFFRSLNLATVRWLPEMPGGLNAQLPVVAPDERDPFFRGVFTAPVTGLTVPKAAPVLTWSRSGRDVLRLRSGGPFLSAFPVGRGTVWLLAAPLDARASDFAANALFLPTLYRLAQASYRAPQQLAYSLGRQRVSLPVRALDARKDVFRLVRDGADSVAFLPEQQVRDGRLTFSPPAELTQAGFYTLRKPGEPPTVLAFNYDKRESDLSQYASAELKAAVATNPHIHVYEAGAGLGAIEQLRADTLGEPLWKYALGAALLFLLLEVLLIRFL